VRLALIREAFSFTSGMYRMSPIPSPRLPSAPRNPRVWNKVTAAPMSCFAYVFPTKSQKKKPRPFPMTDVSMMKNALR